MYVSTACANDYSGIQNGGSARGYQEPSALCGSHGYPARRTAGRPNVYASPVLAVIDRYCRGPSVRELVTELRGGAVCW